MKDLQSMYALIIGAGDDLKASILDANRVYKLLIDQELIGYPEENVILLRDKDAHRSAILQAFDDLKEKTDHDSTLFIYYSGHGGYQLDEYFIQPYGMANRQFTDPDEFRSLWVSANELREKISALPSNKLVVILDCCHAAGMFIEGLAQKIDNHRGVFIITSCKDNQLSWIPPGGENSLFTTCLLEVLAGRHKENFSDPHIKITTVVDFLFEEVPKRARRIVDEDNNPIVQTPYANMQMDENFVLSYLRNFAGSSQESATKPEEDAIAGKEKESKKPVTVFREEEGANNLLLFVHGFTGEAADTFGIIPQLLMEEEGMKGWNMYPFGYTEFVEPKMGKAVWASAKDINRISDYLATSIRHRYGNYDRIAIVAHSLGGLVVQKALLNLSGEHIGRISHLILFGTPSNGMHETSGDSNWKKNLQFLGSDSDYITGLRTAWKERFRDGYPFELKVATGTKDQYVTVQSVLDPFPEKCQVTVAGDHHSMVQPDSRDHDSYYLILNTLTDTPFRNQFTNEEEINIAMGEYTAVVQKLLPKARQLDPRGLQRLVFALEGLGRKEEMMKILEDHPLAEKNSAILGLLGGRYKRRYLDTEEYLYGQESYEYYEKGLALAESKQDKEQVYYHAINLAFLSMILYEDKQKMIAFAELALETAKKDPVDNLWKLATIGEANIYLGDFEKSKEYYGRAAKMADMRQKISMHLNAYTAYKTRTDSGVEDDYVVFLKENFLS